MSVTVVQVYYSDHVVAFESDHCVIRQLLTWNQ